MRLRLYHSILQFNCQPLMIQIDQQQQDPPYFQKEYTRLYFDQLDAIKSEKSITYQTPTKQISTPSFFLDTMRETACLYLLHWKEVQSSKVLLIRSSHEDQWTKISMNFWPQRLAITDDHAFLFGAKELFIISLQSQKIKSVKLEDAKIVDLKLCYTQSKEAGIFVIYFNSKLSYFTKEYSKSSQISFWSKLRSILLSITLKKNEQLDFFQTILPNLIGIALKDNALILYDMNKVTATTLTAPLQNTAQLKVPIIRWVFKQSDKGLTQALHIYILAKNKILHYILHIARIESNEESENANKDISVQFVARGNVIDWTKSIFQHSQHEVKSEFEITNFEVSHDQIIYREESGNLSEIPTIKRVALTNFQQKHAVISQQSSVWYQYFKNPNDTGHFLDKFRHQIEQDHQSLFRQTDSGKKVLKTENDSLYYVNKWRQNNKFQSFLIYNHQPIIVRANSITIFESIPQLQYELQNYTENDRHRDEQLKIGNLLKEYKRFANFDREIVIRQYKEIVKDLKGFVELIHNIKRQKQKEYQCLPSKGKLFLNILRDRICYYEEVIRYVFQDLKYQQKLYKNHQIVRFIGYLMSCFQLQHKYSALSINFISLFIEKIQNSLASINEFNFPIFFKKLMRNLLPESFIAQQRSRKSLVGNEYFDFLINFLLLSNNEDITSVTQQELKKIIVRVFPQFNDKTQPYLINNISFIKGYFLSHPSDQQLLPFCHQLIKSINYSQVVESLKEIFHLIPNQMDLLIKAEISLKKNKLSSQIFANCHSDNLVRIEQRNYTLLAKQILETNFSLNSQDSKYEVDLKAIESCLLELSNTNLSTYQAVQNKLIKLYRERINYEVNHENYGHILQIQEIFLKELTSIFNRNFKKLETNAMGDYQQFMMKLLEHIQVSFLSFKKYFRKLYESDKREIIGGINMMQISKKINQEQTLMSNSFMEVPIKIQNYYLSSIFISLIKRIVSSQSLLKLSAKHWLDFRSDEYVDDLLKEILNVKFISNEEMDFLYFYLLKKGEKYLRRVLAKVEQEAPQKIIKYFQRIQDKDILYNMSEDILTDNNTRMLKESMLKQSKSIK